jgi:cytochrome c-type biogenesis protein CcmH/NrfG
LRKNYALLLIAAAVVVAAVIVFVGTANHTSGSAPPQPVANGSSLPPGHPKIDQNGSASSAPSADYSRMIAALKAKLDKNPTDAATIDALGTAYFMSEQYDKAASAYKRVLGLHPGNAGATVRLAMVYHAQGNDGKAKSLIQGVLKKRPDFQEGHYDLAIIYFSEQSLDRAKAEWQKTASIDPKSKLGRQAQNFVDLMEGRTPQPAAGSD